MWRWDSASASSVACPPARVGTGEDGGPGPRRGGLRDRRRAGCDLPAGHETGDAHEGRVACDDTGEGERGAAVQRALNRVEVLPEALAVLVLGDRYDRQDGGSGVKELRSPGSARPFASDHAFCSHNASMIAPRLAGPPVGVSATSYCTVMGASFGKTTSDILVRARV